jgi:hypothetical protein
MTISSAEEMRRDDRLQYALTRYRDEAAREICAANRPRLLALINTIKPAVAAVQADKETK